MHGEGRPCDTEGWVPWVEVKGGRTRQGAKSQARKDADTTVEGTQGMESGMGSRIMPLTQGRAGAFIC